MVTACRSETDSLKRLTCYNAIEIAQERQELHPKRSSETSAPIATFSGTGSTTTRPFDAPGPFVARVDRGSILLFVKPPMAQSNVATLSTDESSNPEEVYVPKGGRYLLDIMAFEPWRVTILSAE